jgi:hypothetical protein
MKRVDRRFNINIAFPSDDMKNEALRALNHIKHITGKCNYNNFFQAMRLYEKRLRNVQNDSGEMTVSCPVCGSPYVVYLSHTGDQTACPMCRQEARINVG